MPDKIKRIVAGVVVLGALAIGAIGSLPTVTPQGLGVSPATVVYADDCDGIGPQPDLDCPSTPTPTPTPDPNH